MFECLFWNGNIESYLLSKWIALFLYQMAWVEAVEVAVAIMASEVICLAASILDGPNGLEMINNNKVVEAEIEAPAAITG